MSWDRFGFYCRELARHTSGSLKREYENISQSAIASEYGSSIKRNSLQSYILEKLLGDIRRSENDILRVFSIYGSLDFSILSERPSVLKRIGVYISYLTIIYILMSSTYGFFVTPQISTFLSSLSASYGYPVTFDLFVEDGPVFSILVILALLVVYLISRKVLKLMKFINTKDTSLVYKYLIPGKIKIKYEKIHKLILIPAELGQDNESRNDPVSDYLSFSGHNDKEIAGELSKLIAINYFQMNKYCESYIRRLYVVISVLIVFSIFLYLIGAYSPLFKLGSI